MFLSVNVKNTKFISTFSTTSIHGNYSSLFAKYLAILLSSCNTGGMVLRANKAGPATTPGFLKFPPSILRSDLNFFMNYLDPATIEPIGAPSPLLKQIMTESQFFTNYFGYMFN